MRYFRRMWRSLTTRSVMFGSAQIQTPVRVKRWEHLTSTRRHYSFSSNVYRPEWGEWRKVGSFAEQIRDDKGRLITLRINTADLGMENSEDSWWWIDDQSLVEEPR